ncbi:nuclear transport factor 2 family protein [Streptomyces sp. NPDC047108]|uniref:nuclear transport factor 2 family protein n=1 Tax=Streptomyces sp. NPDC047108 TaxID=3155025 RepID=UPI0033D78B4A
MPGRSRSAVVAGVLIGAVLPALYEAAVGAMVRHNARRLAEGDLEPQLRSYADDVRFIFPGRSSWAGEFRGKRAVEKWLQRFVDAGLRIEFDDVLVSGPPWATRVCLRFHDIAEDERGETVYENEGVIYGHVRWGKLTRYMVFEDTQRGEEFDPYLAERGI